MVYSTVHIAENIKSKINSNILVSFLGVILLTCALYGCYFFIQSIQKTVGEYKQNNIIMDSKTMIAAIGSLSIFKKLKTLSSNDMTEDNEVYTVALTDIEHVSDYDKFKKKLDKLHEIYEQYNTQVISVSKSLDKNPQDVINEEIFNDQYDDYVSERQTQKDAFDDV